MRRVNFSNDNTNAVFAVNSYSDFSKLMFDTARGMEKVSKDEANEKIREIMFQVLGVDKDTDTKTIRKAIRRNKVAVYEVIEETLDNLLVSGWGDNPFFNDNVEMRNTNAGDKNEFYVPGEMILTVSELAGNHHDINEIVSV